MPLTRFSSLAILAILALLPGVGSGVETGDFTATLPADSSSASAPPADADPVGAVCDPRMGETDERRLPKIEVDPNAVILWAQEALWIQSAFENCLRRPPSEREIAEIGALFFPVRDPAAIQRYVCESPEAATVAFVVSQIRERWGWSYPSDSTVRSYVSSGLTHDALAAAIGAAPNAIRFRVSSAYWRCLHRVAQPAEVAGWLASGKPIEQIEVEICGSVEARTLMVNTAYQECLGRPPSPTDLAGYSASYSAEQIWSLVCSSPEAQKRRRIAQLFEDCLGRPPTPSDYAYWTARPISDERMASDICESPEGRTYAAEYAYRRCLGRAPAPGDTAAWAAQNIPRIDVIRRICTSAEANANLSPSYYRGPPANHLVAESGKSYDYYQNHCWTGSNNAIATAPATTGIIKCNTRMIFEGGHAFIYQLNADGTTTYVNWGSRCSCPGTPPATFSSRESSTDCHSVCVRKFCGDQIGWFMGTLPPGQTLPVNQSTWSPHNCAELAAGYTAGILSSRLAHCESCCEKGRLVSDGPKNESNAAHVGYWNFLRACRLSCRQSFGASR